MAKVDGRYGLYDPEARMVKLARGPWYCGVCNAVRSNMPTAHGQDPLCPACQDRWARDKPDAAIAAAPRVWTHGRGVK